MQGCVLHSLTWATASTWRCALEPTVMAASVWSVYRDDEEEWKDDRGVAKHIINYMAISHMI